MDIACLTNVTSTFVQWILFDHLLCLKTHFPSFLFFCVNVFPFLLAQKPGLFDGNGLYDSANLTSFLLLIFSSKNICSYSPWSFISFFHLAFYGSMYLSLALSLSLPKSISPSSSLSIYPSLLMIKSFLFLTKPEMKSFQGEQNPTAPSIPQRSTIQVLTKLFYA